MVEERGIQMLREKKKGKVVFTVLQGRWYLHHVRSLVGCIISEWLRLYGPWRLSLPLQNHNGRNGWGQESSLQVGVSTAPFHLIGSS